MTTVFVSSLPFRADEGFIRKLFEPYGRVINIDLHADWVNPAYEPFAYVELDIDDLAQVVDELDGQKFGQNHIRVHQRVPAPGGAVKLA